MNADFPCIRGVLPVGTEKSIDDGHKYGCGLQYIEGDPIVYSFGSNKSQEFELGMLYIRPDSKVFSFEIDEKAMVSTETSHSSVKNFNIGLGYNKDNLKMKTLKEIMYMFNHTYIDVLKLDIEGGEYSFFNEEASLLNNVGQLMVEIHNVGLEKKLKKKNITKYLRMIEMQGLRMFHKENNVYAGGCCVELSFVRLNWEKWNKKLKYEIKVRK